MDIAGEAKLGEIIEQPLSEPAGLRQPGDFLRREAQPFEKIERLLESGREQEAAPAGSLRMKNSNTAVFVSP